MKLIVAIVKDIDADNVTSALTSANYRVTTIASTSGFLRRGLNTMLWLWSTTDSLKMFQRF